MTKSGLGGPRSFRPDVRPSWAEGGCVFVLLVLTYHHRWVMDDATIYFRYIDNWLLLGRGLVFNAGEYVEGFTSPLWLLLLAVGRLFGLAYWTWSLVLGLACALAAGLGCIALARRFKTHSTSSEAGRAVNLPLIVLAGHYGTQSHFTSGLETGLVQLYGVVVALWALVPRSRGLQILLGFAPLVRPELALVNVLAALRLLWLDRRVPGLSRVPWTLVVSTGFIGGGWLLFRVYYYADFFPNTYYLKGHQDWAQGLAYLQLEVLGGLGVLFVALIGLALAFRNRSLGSEGSQEQETPPSEHEFPRAFMVLVAVLLGLWTVRIGGDMGYHRFFAFSFTLLCCALVGVGETTFKKRARWQQGAFTILALAAGLGCYPTDALSKHPLSPTVTSLQWRGIEDAEWHRSYKDLIYSDKRIQEDHALREAYTKASQPTQHHDRALRAFCEWAFLRFDTHVVHTYGLTDAVLARVDSEVRRPGHRNLWYHARDLMNSQNMVVGKAGQVRLGLYRTAVARGKAAPWIVKGLPSIELIERKIYNRHDLFENLKLALTPVPRIAR